MLMALVLLFLQLLGSRRLKRESSSQMELFKLSTLLNDNAVAAVFRTTIFLAATLSQKCLPFVNLFGAMPQSSTRQWAT
jgi:hypothetical protein